MDAVLIKSLLNKKSLSSDDKTLIQSTYLSKFGKQMRLKNTKCRDCYNDALFELLNFKNVDREIIFNGRLLKTTTK
jgi:hypothetical protein